MSLVIRRATSPADLEAIARLRYRIAVEELHRDSTGVDHERGTVSDEFDKTGRHFVADADGVIVGAVRVNLGKDGPMPNQEWFSLDQFSPFVPEEVSVTDRLVVTEAYRSSFVPGKLAMACYAEGIEEAIEFDFVLTRPHLVSLYRQMGHRSYHVNIDHPKYGIMTPMTLTVRDFDYLKEIRSPFSRLARNQTSDGRSRSHFETTFPDWSGIRPTSALSEDELWVQFGEDLFERNQSGENGFVSGLSREEIGRLLKMLTPLHFASGQAIVRQGEIGQGVFCLLEGEARVQLDGEGNEKELGRLSAGDLFGEMSFLNGASRNASVYADGDVRAVILTPQHFDRLRKTDSDLALKIMTNLFATVASRYEEILSLVSGAQE